MPWKERSIVEERMRFVLRLKDGESMASLCREFGISRVTGYKIYARYKECGLEGLTVNKRAMPIGPHWRWPGNWWLICVFRRASSFGSAKSLTSVSGESSAVALKRGTKAKRQAITLHRRAISAIRLKMTFSEKYRGCEQRSPRR